jgi:Na+/H+-dicarboxylate symporter
MILDEKHEIDPRFTRLILTLGSALNKDGAALHIAVAAIFIAQVR